MDERTQQMLNLYLKGFTLQEIGGIYNGLSRERVRQLLSKIPEYQNREFKWNISNRRPEVTLTCKECRKKIKTRNDTQVFCNRECSKAFLKNRAEKRENLTMRFCTNCKSVEPREHFYKMRKNMKVPWNSFVCKIKQKEYNNRWIK